MNFVLRLLDFLITAMMRDGAVRMEDYQIADRIGYSKTVHIAETFMSWNPCQTFVLDHGHRRPVLRLSCDIQV